VAGWRFSHGYTENLAHGVVLAVTNEAASGRIYNLAEKESLPRAEWLRKIGQVAGWQGQVVTVPKEQLPAHLQHNLDTDQHWVVDTSRIREELGYQEPVSLEEGLRRTIEWEWQHPPEKLDPKAFDDAAEDEVLARLSSA
jgi:nucleoside-diphosphate-sugar epimerase